MNALNRPIPVDKIIDYEQGMLPDAEVLELFQYLIDTGLCWQLQGHYGRQAAALIEAGYCDPAVTNEERNPA